MVFRDFNEILFHSEKWGEKDCPNEQLDDFKEVLTVKEFGLQREPIYLV